MKKYKLLRDLPTFKAGDKFYMDASGNLCAEDRQNTGFCKLIAYSKFTLDRFPTILTDWFEEIKDEWKPWREEIGEDYLAIDAFGELTRYSENGNIYDNLLYSIGDYAPDTKEGEEHLKRFYRKLQAYQTVERDAKGFEADWSGGQMNYIVVYDSLVHKIKVTFCVHERSIGQIYFATRDDAEHSLANHEDEWRLLFDLDKEEK